MATSDKDYQLPASIETTHEMIVAVGIMAGAGMLAVIVAGQSKTAGNAIAAALGIMLLVQGITHVNPFVSFLAAHPLTPTVLTTNNPHTGAKGTPGKSVGRLKAE
jgi:hypothetical protein